jgi:hypothetical protein
MINETSVEISHEYKRWQVELESRYARRNKVRHIDRLLNQLELLNLTESPAMPPALRQQIKSFLDECEHSLSLRPARDLTVGGTMEALYEIQDTLLLGGDDEEEEG